MNEEISLRELIQILWNGKKIIAAITLFCIFCGVFYSIYILEPVYEARTILSVNRNIQSSSKAEGLEGLVENLTELPQVNAASYAAQVKTAAVECVK